ncbi:MAG: MaoC family dehydratase [Cyclobacteriaceae bacterium]|jgi:acyl dehydratase|nr:MaoC family dehydratase [Cyclobacteriaceae bacterium]HQQ97669.1 MaoC family dehydratase [Cyclobacteriaceae bacterium]
MSKLVISSYAEFEQYAGKELGVSDWVKISQPQINQFADATLDHQWIHTDPERAARETEFKSTIAHGYLTLSLVPHLWDQITEFHNIKMMINYGIEKLKFNQPVMVNSEVRLRAKLHSITNLRGIAKFEVDVTLEIKDNPKPAFRGLLVFLYHFL